MRRLGGRVLIMDVFDDLYEFCLLMLELDRNDIVVEIINKIEEPIKNTRIANINFNTSLNITYIMLITAPQSQHIIF